MSSLKSERMRRKRGRVSQAEKRPRPYRNRRTRLENAETENEESIFKSESAIFDEEVVIKIENEDFDGEIDVEGLPPKNKDDEIQHEEMFSDKDGFFENKKSFLTPENRRKKKVKSWRDIEEEIEDETEEEYSQIIELMQRMENAELDPLAQPRVYEEDLIKSDFDCDIVPDSGLSDICAMEVHEEVPHQFLERQSQKEPVDSDLDEYTSMKSANEERAQERVQEPPLISPKFDNSNNCTEQKRNASQVFDDLLAQDIEIEKKAPREKKMYRKRITDPKLVVWFSKNVEVSKNFADCTKLVTAEKEREIRDLQIIGTHSAEKERHDSITTLAEELWNSTERLPTFDEMFEDD